jgi:rSAM/selenodomain-associated transferase 1
MKNQNALIIFAKSPEAGNVKTRLAGHLDDAERLRLYTSMLEGTVGKLRSIPEADTLICYVGDKEYFTKFGLKLFPQSEGDLGERMHLAMKKLLDEGYGKAVLVGVDIPGLTPAIIREAFKLLSDHDAVFGPASDGGYYLVGLKAPNREIFTGIEWSTNTTLKQTLAKAKAAGLKITITDILSDVDRPEDLKNL